MVNPGYDFGLELPALVLAVSPVVEIARKSVFLNCGGVEVIEYGGTVVSEATGGSRQCRSRRGSQSDRVGSAGLNGNGRCELGDEKVWPLNGRTVDISRGQKPGGSGRASPDVKTRRVIIGIVAKADGSYMPVIQSDVESATLENEAILILPVGFLAAEVK